MSVMMMRSTGEGRPKTEGRKRKEKGGVPPHHAIKAVSQFCVIITREQATIIISYKKILHGATCLSNHSLVGTYERHPNVALVQTITLFLPLWLFNFYVRFLTLEDALLPRSHALFICRQRLPFSTLFVHRMRIRRCLGRDSRGPSYLFIFIITCPMTPIFALKALDSNYELFYNYVFKKL